jgi:biopolymer transport protein ExbB
MRCLHLLLLTSLLALTDAGLAFGQDKIDLPEVMRKVQKELEQTQNRLAAERKGREKQRLDLMAQIAEDRKRVGELEKKNLHLRKEIDRIAAESGELNDWLALAATQIPEVREEVREKALEYSVSFDVTLAAIISQKIKAKKKQFDQIIEDEKVETAGLVNAIFDLVKTELEAGTAIEISKETIETQYGKHRSADILRVGNVAAIFRSKGSGGTSGIAWVPLGTRSLSEGVIGRGDRRAVEKAWSTLDNKTSEVLALPMDVTSGAALEEHKARKSLWETVQSGGPVMIPLALIALAGLILIANRFWVLSRIKENVDDLMIHVCQDCREGDFDGALGHVAGGKGPVERVLKAGLMHRTTRKEVLEDVMHEAILHETPNLERFLSAIGVLAAVAPLLGLLGTVAGMISTFTTMTLYGSGDPQLMAGGISEALITTATGLIIAIPLLLLHNVLASRVEKIIFSMEENAVKLINTLVPKDEVAPKPAEKDGSNA